MFTYDIYSTSNDAFFIQEGARIFRIMTGGLIFISIQVIAGAVFQAFGYSGRALFVSLSRQFVFFIPLSFIATLIFGLDGLWITFLTSDVLSGIISYFMLRKEIIHLEEMVEIPSESKEVYV